MGTVRTVTSEDAVDADGISLVTTTRSASPDDPRQGLAYTPTNLAAFTPVHFHPLTPGRYLMVFSRHWISSVVSATDPGAYTTSVEVPEPGWAIVSGAGAEPPADGSYLMPGSPGRTLTAATSRGQDYLFTLSATADGGHIQHFRYSPVRTTLTQAASETLPDVGDVHFDMGLHIGNTDLHVFGTDNDGRIYRARKSWGRIGTNPSTGVALSPELLDTLDEADADDLRVRAQRLPSRAGQRDEIEDPSWQYRTDTGWSRDPADLAPWLSTINSVGPVSLATFRSRTYLATVSASGAVRTGHIWSTLPGMTGWKAEATSVALGEGENYLGGTIQLQQHIRAQGGQTAIPFVTSNYVSELVDAPDPEDDPIAQSRLDVAWDKLPVMA